MSLVGTRPILQDELRQYELHHRARIAIKPGMYWQWSRSCLQEADGRIRSEVLHLVLNILPPCLGLG